MCTVSPSLLTPIPKPSSFRPKLSISMGSTVLSGSAFSNLISPSFYLQPVQRLKGKPENAFDRKAADLLAMRTSSVFGAPDIIRPTVNTAACFQLPPVPVIPRQSAPALTPPILGNTALSGPVLTLATQPKASDRNGVTSVLGSPGTYVRMSARFSPIPQVLTTPGFPTKGALHSTSFPTSSTTKEPRGDM